jgi:hypothetical protein
MGFGNINSNEVPPSQKTHSVLAKFEILTLASRYKDYGLLGYDAV